MSDAKVASSGGGVSFAGLLTVLFIGLKLTNTIDWTWFWVLSPVIFSAILIVLILIIAGIVILTGKKK